MANIHGIGEFRGQRGGGQAVQRGGDVEAQQFDQDDSDRINLIQGPKQPGVVIQDLCPRLFPGIKWKACTTVLSIFELIMFIVTLIVGGVCPSRIAEQGGCNAFVVGNEMLGPSSATLRFMGAKYEPDIRAGEVWLLVSPIMLHAGVIHLASNLFFQLRFGYVFEIRWTIPRFLAMYILTGIGASFMSSVLSPSSTSVGASGALFGLIGADVTYLIYNWNNLPQNKMEACFLVVVIIINFILGISTTGIDNWAHLGGLLTGLISAIWLLPHRSRHTHDKIFWGVSLGLTCGWFLMWSLLLWVGNP